MEGTLLEIRSIALSQLREGTVIRWHAAEKFAADVIRKLTSVEWPRGVLMNVNFPIVPPAKVAGVQFVRQGRRTAGIEIVPIKDPLNRPYLWIGDFLSDDAVGPDTDLAATRAGAIAVTPLHLDLTHGATLAKLRRRLREPGGPQDQADHDVAAVGNYRHGGAGRHRADSARGLRAAAVPRSGLREPDAADRAWPDSQPTRSRRDDDAGARIEVAPQGFWRSAPARATRRPCCRGWRAASTRSSATSRC